MIKVGWDSVLDIYVMASQTLDQELNTMMAFRSSNGSIGLFQHLKILNAFRQPFHITSI